MAVTSATAIALFLHTGIVQLVERRSPKPKVVSSSLTSRANQELK